MGLERHDLERQTAWVVPSHWRHTWKLSGNPLEELSPEQKARLHELQRLLHAEGAWSKEYHDFYSLRRFLKARDWDVAKAKTMWQEMLAFRANNHVDTILHDFVFTERERVLAAYPHGLHKVDREGRPVLVYKFGGLDLDALEKITSTQRITQFHIQEYERIMRCVLPACSLLAGRHIEKVVTLIDVAGIRMRDIGRVLELLSTYIKVDGSNYPETLAAMIIINAPMWFSGSFSLIKRMLSAETQKKVQILGSNYQQTLHGIVAPENLLPDFGGTSSGRLADSIGPWTAVLEQLRQTEEAAAAAAAAPQPSLTAKTGAGLTTKLSVGLSEQISPIADVKQRDDDAHVTSQSRRAVSGSGSQHPSPRTVHVEHMVLLPPEPAALPGSTPEVWDQTQGAHAGQKHPRPAEDHHVQGVTHAKQAVHGTGDDMQGVELHELHHDQHHPQHTGPQQQHQHPGTPTPTENGTGPPQHLTPLQPPHTAHAPVQPHSQPHAPGPTHPAIPHKPHLNPIAESNTTSDLTAATATAGAGGHGPVPFTPGEDMLSPLPPPITLQRPDASTLDSFYSIPDSQASWMSGDMGPLMNTGPLQAIIAQQQQQQQRVGQRVVAPGVLASGVDMAVHPQVHRDHVASPQPLTEAGLRSHHSMDSNQGMYKSLDNALDAVSIVSFESCRSGESFTGSASLQAGWSQNVGGGSPVSTGSRPLQGKNSYKSSSSRREGGRDAGGGRGRLPKWMGGGKGGVAEQEVAHDRHDQLPQNWGWDEAGQQRQTGGPPASGPYAVLPSFTAWGSTAPLLYAAAPGPDGPVYVPAGVPLPSMTGAGGTPVVGVLPPGYLATLPNPLLHAAGAMPGLLEPVHNRATAQINEYMRMWLHSAAEVFAGRSPMSASSRQQLLDPTEGSLIGDAPPGAWNGQLAGRASAETDLEGVGSGGASGHSVQGLRARTRAEMILGAVRHKRANSGSHMPLRVGSLSDEPMNGGQAPSNQAMETPDGAVRSPTAATGAAGKLPAVSYEVYVDSEDEDGSGLLHRGPRQVLPRYGVVRMFLRRVFCCCGSHF